jgi:hypothetical protein
MATASSDARPSSRVSAEIDLRGVRQAPADRRADLADEYVHQLVPGVEVRRSDLLVMPFSVVHSPAPITASEST